MAMRGCHRRVSAPASVDFRRPRKNLEGGIGGQVTGGINQHAPKGRSPPPISAPVPESPADQEAFSEASSGKDHSGPEMPVFLGIFLVYYCRQKFISN